jgi:thiol-disulfide isomerase/thioredoxin
MMRILLRFFTAFFVIFTSGTIIAKDIRIRLQVSNPSTNAVYIQEAHLEAGGVTTTHRIDLSAAGYAEFIYPITNAGFVEFNYNGYLIPVYLDTDSSPTISFDGRNISNTLQFSGQGSADNNFIAQFDKLSGGTQMASMDCAYMDITFSQMMVSKGQQLSASEYLSALNQRYNSQQNLIAQHSASISSSVKNFYSTKAKYQRDSDKLYWILYRYNQLDASAIQSTKVQLNLGQGVSWSNDAAVNNPTYKNALKANTISSYLPNDPFQSRAYTKIYEQIERQLSGMSRCYMTTYLLLKVYEKSGNSELGRSKISQLQSACPQYTDAIMQMYGGDISGVENISAEDIDMIDKKGNLISLTDYQGKVVYVSFWASWCKPCIAGFKKSQDIRKRLQDMGVVLINISIDKEEEAWRDAMIRHNPLGVNTWAISLQDLAKDYDISSIPLYHIINKQGKFAYLSDQQSRDIVDEFRFLVEQ